MDVRITLPMNVSFNRVFRVLVGCKYLSALEYVDFHSQLCSQKHRSLFLFYDGRCHRRQPLMHLCPLRVRCLIHHLFPFLAQLESEVVVVSNVCTMKQ